MTTFIIENNRYFIYMYKIQMKSISFGMKEKGKSLGHTY
jgi:hypothetical protein